MYTDVNACGCTRWCTDSVRVCAESWHWEKNSLLQRGIKPASVACRSDTLPTELHPHPLIMLSLAAWSLVKNSNTTCTCIVNTCLQRNVKKRKKKKGALTWTSNHQMCYASCERTVLRRQASFKWKIIFCPLMWRLNVLCSIMSLHCLCQTVEWPVCMCIWP